MTLKEMKIKTFSLIEEYYPEHNELAEDEDVRNKINGIVNSIQMDLMKYRKINASQSFTIAKKDSKTINLTNRIEDLYQVKSIIFNDDEKEIEYKMPNEITLVLPEDYEGIFTIYYYKYPTLVEILFDTKQERLDEDEDYEFELDPDILEIMPYGIAADLLKMDMISNYGRYFEERYKSLLQTIDSRRVAGMVNVTGGLDI